MLSVIILTKNEENNIKNCLESVKWCDEIIIIDDNSTDQTLEIAKTYKTTIYQRNLNNDFATQRNFGLEKAKGEWVLFLDADERISLKLAQEIKSICYPSEIVSSMGTEQKETSLCWQDKNVIKGFYIFRKDIFLGRLLKHGEAGKIKFLRLAKKEAGKWKRKVHEVWEIKGETSILKNEMAHYPHQTLTEFLQNINHYSTINAQVFWEQGKKTNIGEIIFYPLGKFLVNYIFKLGFLDGTPGFIQAMMMSLHSFLTRGKLWLKQNKSTNCHSELASLAVARRQRQDSESI